MHKSHNFIVLGLLLWLIQCQPSITTTSYTTPGEPSTCILGVDNFLANYLHLVEGKRVGLLTNPSGVNSKLILTSDLLFNHPGINLTTLYGPEHGIRGAIHAGEKLEDAKDPKTNLPIYSLYGSRRKPTAESLRNVDIILVDIQDIGLRAYTYIYTMALMMEAAEENNKEVLILDRPNPINGNHIAGNILEKDYSSFVGLYPIPYRHGMTIGELALLFNNEYGINCSLKVVPLQGWKRSMYWNETGLDWIPTSPHVPHWQTILYMAATGTFGELGVLSEGVGYTSPFEIFGAPWIDGEQFASRLNELNLPGILFRPLYFRPYYLRYKGEICQGAQLHITDLDSFEPYSTGLSIIQTHMKMYPEHRMFAETGRVKMFDKVVGSDKIRKDLLAGKSIPEIVNGWKASQNVFKQLREKYLIYN